MLNKELNKRYKRFMMKNNTRTRWKMIKYGCLIIVCLVIARNIFLSFDRSLILSSQKSESSTEIKEKLVLAKLAYYYEDLLKKKGINVERIKKAAQDKRGEIFDVFENEESKPLQPKRDRLIEYDSREVLFLPPKEADNKEPGILEIGVKKVRHVIKNEDSKNLIHRKKDHLAEHESKTDLSPLSREDENKENKISAGDEQSRNFRMTSKRTIYKGLLVDWWFDFCLCRVTWKSLWHPLYPHIPQRSTTAFKTEDDKRYVGGVYRRIYGFFFTKKDAVFDFKFASRDGAEFIIMDTGLSTEEIDKLSSNITYNKVNEIIHIRLTKALMDYQDKKIKLSEMFTKYTKNIKLKRNRFYHIEILQGGKYFGKYSLQWREKGTKQFSALNEDVLFHFNLMCGKNTPSVLRQKYHPEVRFKYDEDENRRVTFHEKFILDSNKLIQESGFKCPAIKKDYKKISYVYQGYYEYIESAVVYPKEYFHFIQTGIANLRLPEDEAKTAANQVFEKITNLYQNKLEIVDIVHVQTNYNKSFQKFEDISKTYYFVELDVKFTDDESKVYRASHIVKPLPSGSICFATEYKWEPGVTIHLLTPIRNQRSWFLYMIQMLEEIMEKTKEANVNLITIDYNSTDGNYQEILKSSKLKYTYLNPVVDAKYVNKTKFNKVKAMNYGIRHVTDKNSIIFILDLHLQLPLNIFDRIRKLTTQGRTAYNPSLLKLGCGEHEQYTDVTDKSEWLDYGTGMMAMFASDWDLVGGFDEKKFGNKWGGEDWEVMDRIVANGIYIIHQRMQRFYHVHHSKAGMWNS